MDNFHIDITSEGDLTTSLLIAFGGRKAIGYAIREPIARKKWDAPEGLDKREHYKLGIEREGKPKRLVFFWSATEASPDFVAFPFQLDAAGAADFARRWLETVDMGRQPDHDGDNGRGWRVYCEGWGQVDGQWSAFVAVAPAWAMYGK